MSLLDDARALLSDGPPDWDSERQMWECPFCMATAGPFDDVERDSEAAFVDFTHEDYCAWLSMPKIVEALEAAEKFARIWNDHIEQINSGSDVAADTLNASSARLRLAMEG